MTGIRANLGCPLDQCVWGHPAADPRAYRDLDAGGVGPPTSVQEAAQRAVMAAASADDTAVRAHLRDDHTLVDFLTTIARLKAELAEYEQVFELGWNRTQKATELWRAEDPAARALIMPDMGALIEWLIARGDRPPAPDAQRS